MFSHHLMAVICTTNIVAASEEPTFVAMEDLRDADATVARVHAAVEGDPALDALTPAQREALVIRVGELLAAHAAESMDPLKDLLTS